MLSGQNNLFWKKRYSDYCTYSDSLASILDPSIHSRPDIPTLLLHCHELTYTLNCLKSARLSLDECQATADTPLRAQHLEERTEHAARHSDTATETALNNILKAEEVRRTFQKLRKHAKGYQHSTLCQRVEIPVLLNGTPTGQTTSFSDPVALFDAIIAQNSEHFSQATPSPGASGYLSTILPPPPPLSLETT